MKSRLVIAIVMVGITLLSMTSSVLAYGEGKLAPPELDKTEANRWANSLPTARPYLARIWGIDQRTAEAYGAQYKMPTCGIAASDPTGNTPASSTIAIPKGDSYYEITLSTANTGSTSWGTKNPYIEPFVPIPVDYSKPEEDKVVALAYYEYPPTLDRTQGVRWGQALPSARFYLARLWEVPMETAAEYGAR